MGWRKTKTETTGSARSRWSHLSRRRNVWIQIGESTKLKHLRTFGTPATRWLHSTAWWNVSSRDPRWNVCRICWNTRRAASNAPANYMYLAAVCANRLFLHRSAYLRRVWLTRTIQPLTRSCYLWNRALPARWNFRHVLVQPTPSSFLVSALPTCTVSAMRIDLFFQNDNRFLFSHCQF